MPDAYVKQTWVDGVAGGTPVSAARLAHIEDGIENATVEDGTYAEAAATTAALATKASATDNRFGRTIAVRDYGTGRDAFNSALAAASNGDVLLAQGTDFEWEARVTVNKQVTVRGPAIITVTAQGALYAAASNVTWEDITFYSPNKNIELFTTKPSTSQGDYENWKFSRCVFDGVSPRFTRIGRTLETGVVVTSGSDIAGRITWDKVEVKNFLGSNDGCSFEGVRTVTLNDPHCHDNGIFREFTDASMSLGSAALTSASAAFVAGDAGATKWAIVHGAGPRGEPLAALVSAYVSPTEVTLSRTAFAAVSGAKARIGDNAIGEGIKVSAGTTGFRMVGGVLEDNARDGIDLYDSVGSEMIGTICRRNGGYGVEAKWSDLTNANSPKRAKLIGVKAYSNGSSGLNANMPEMQVIGCEASFNNVAGIRTSGSTPNLVPTEGVVLLGNETHANGADGIACFTGRHVVINSHVGNDNGGWGVSLGTTADKFRIGTVVGTGNASGRLQVQGTGHTVMESGRAQAFMKATRYYAPEGTRTTLAMVSGTEYAVPIEIGRERTAVAIGCEVTVAGTAGTLIRLGIRADDGTGHPGTLLLDAGTVAGDGITASGIEAVISQALVPGLYWLTATAQNTGGTLPTVRAILGGRYPVAALDLASAVSASALVGMTQTGVTGALPAAWNGTARTGSPALVALKSA